MDSLQVVRNCTVQLRSECTSFRGFVVGMLDQLDMMRSRLAEREGWVNAHFRAGLAVQHDRLELQSRLIVHTKKTRRKRPHQQQRVPRTWRLNTTATRSRIANGRRRT
jgi:hypothetical protein